MQKTESAKITEAYSTTRPRIIADPILTQPCTHELRTAALATDKWVDIALEKRDL